MSTFPQCGYVYVAAGDKYIEEAIVSATSLKKVAPKAHITLISNATEKPAIFDHLVTRTFNKSNWKEGIEYKINGILLSPYERSFYLDSDTLVGEDCSGLFELLDHYDLLLAHAPVDLSNVLYEGKPLYGYYPYNTGVMVYRMNDTNRALFVDWQRCYDNNFEHYEHDQPALMEALLTSPAKVYVLHSLFNARTPFFLSFPQASVKILHDRLPDMEGTLKSINTHPDKHRVWHPGKKRVLLRNSLLSQLKGTLAKLVRR